MILRRVSSIADVSPNEWEGSITENKLEVGDGYVTSTMKSYGSSVVGGPWLACSSNDLKESSVEESDSKRRKGQEEDEEDPSSLTITGDSSATPPYWRKMSGKGMVGLATQSTCGSGSGNMPQTEVFPSCLNSLAIGAQRFSS